MAAKSKFKVSKTFKEDMKKLKKGILVAAEAGMGAAIEMAELEAQENARWAEAGPNFFSSNDPHFGSTTWDWTVTGMSRASIVGYVASRGLLPNLPSVAFPDTTTRVDGRPIGGPRAHRATPPKAQTAGLNEVKAVLARYGDYAGALRLKEITGSGAPKGSQYTKSGHQMAPGLPIEEQTMARWRAFFVPKFLIPRMRAEMARVIASLG